MARKNGGSATKVDIAKDRASLASSAGSRPFPMVISSLFVNDVKNGPTISTMQHITIKGQVNPKVAWRSYPMFFLQITQPTNAATEMERLFDNGGKSGRSIERLSGMLSGRKRYPATTLIIKALSKRRVTKNTMHTNGQINSIKVGDIMTRSTLLLICYGKAF